MRPVWFVVIAVGAAVLGAGGWWVSQRLWPPAGPTGTEPAAAARNVDPANLPEARVKVEAVLAGAQEYAPFFKLLRETFPADYAVDLDRFASRAAANGQLDAVDVYFTDAYRALRQTRGIVAAKASPEALTRLFDAYTAVLKALGAADTHLCVDFIYGGATQAYYNFAGTHRPVVAELGNAGLAAIIDGARRKAERVPPGDGDFQALEKALAASGLNTVEIGLLIDAKTPDPPIPDARTCLIEQTSLTAIKSLPEDRRQRFYRFKMELMAHS